MLIGIRESSKTVPTVTVNCFLHARHLYSPFRPGFLLVGFGVSVFGAFDWSNIWIYLLAPLFGGAAAALTFLYVQPAEKIEGDIEAAPTH